MVGVDVVASGMCAILMYPSPMTTWPRFGFALLVTGIAFSAGCSDSISFDVPDGGGVAGSGGRGGVAGDAGAGGAGGVGGMIDGDAGLDCNEVGCDDGNECTIDGVCNTLMGVCTGGGIDKVIDTPCRQDGGFFCDGEGNCVVCNEDAQCARFFPPQDCRAAAVCEDNACPIPDPLPDGTPCASGQCFQGECVAVLPQQKLVPMVCDNPVSPSYWEIPMDMTVAPSAIRAAQAFTADIRTTLSVPREFLQFGLIAVFPTELTSLEITSAGAEVVTEGVLSGSPVSTTRGTIPVTLPIPQAPNEGDSGGSVCVVDGDCPLAEFGQACGPNGRCECACRSGCQPAACANIATGDVLVPLNPIFKARYKAATSGQTCFDVGGANPPSAIGAPPLRTGIRAVASNGAFVRFECVGGMLGNQGAIVPNAASSQICFPIETPELDSCEGPPAVDCSDDNQCASDSLCDPFTGDCIGGTNEPRGTPCGQDGGTVCDGQGACVQCVEDSDCADDGNQCTTAPDCQADACRPQAALPQGTVCDQDGGNRCDGNGSCISIGGQPFPETEVLTLGCSDEFGDVSLLPFELTVAPGAPVAGQSFVADLSGAALVSEALLDAVQWVIPGGATRINLIDLQATVQVRTGATGDDVSLVSAPVAYRCAVDSDAACDPVNDLPGVPGRRGNADCVPIGPTNPCGRFIDVPVSDDCSAGGTCATLDGGTATKLNQCAINGFCVTDGLSLPLASRVGQYVAAQDGDVLFGWADQGTGATLDGDGTWSLPPAVFADPLGPNGIRLSIQGLSVALECTMGVDSNGVDGVGVPGQSSLTPDARLISFSIQAP